MRYFPDIFVQVIYNGDETKRSDADNLYDVMIPDISNNYGQKARNDLHKLNLLARGTKPEPVNKPVKKSRKKSDQQESQQKKECSRKIVVYFIQLFTFFLLALFMTLTVEELEHVVKQMEVAEKICKKLDLQYDGIYQTITMRAYGQYLKLGKSTTTSTLMSNNITLFLAKLEPSKPVAINAHDLEYYKLQKLAKILRESRDNFADKQKSIYHFTFE